ncbi:MAG: hypothetical protein ACXWKC_05970 [Xanthobacteraceae bacterium]
MSRQPLRFSSNEDRQTYRKWMRILAVTYCSLFVLTLATASLRVHQNLDNAKTTSETLAVANLAR